MAVNFYMDLETIPSQSPAVHARIAEKVTPPGNLSKADTIAAWEADKKPALVKEAIAKTSFDGAYGHICCIGWAWNDDEPHAHCIGSIAQEKAFLEDCVRLWEDRLAGTYGAPTIIGHNVVNFDLRFLWQRAIILGVKMPAWLPIDAKPWGQDTFDTMTAFAGSRGTIGMDRLCEAMGLPGKGEIDGSMVADLWAKGQYETISTYCKGDIERTRAIHRRMQVALGQAA